MTALQGSLLAASTCVLLVFFVAAVVNLLTAHRLEAAPIPRDSPLVSVLVPARDEGINLAENLPALLALEYPCIELIVLDDGSEDDTRTVVEGISAASPGRIRVLNGTPPPEGWLGKNWACHQLAAHARGEILVFCDADVRPRSDAVGRTVGFLRANAADAISAVPRQRFGSWLESAVIPLIVQLPLLTLLPLRLIGSTREPSISVANGQWLALTRAAYDAIGGHTSVRDRVVEDVALGRRVKAAGRRLGVAIAPEALEVRMYSTPSALREGFRKNLYPLLGGQPIGLALGLLVFIAAALLPLWTPLFWGSVGLVPLILLIMVRACGVLLFRHGWSSLVLHPVGSLLVIGLVLDSFVAARRAAVVWKGRTLPTATASPFDRSGRAEPTA